jgi:hypothetical protein
MIIFFADSISSHSSITFQGGVLELGTYGIAGDRAMHKREEKKERSASLITVKPERSTYLWLF